MNVMLSGSWFYRALTLQQRNESRRLTAQNSLQTCSEESATKVNELTPQQVCIGGLVLLLHITLPRHDTLHIATYGQLAILSGSINFPPLFHYPLWVSFSFSDSQDLWFSTE